MQTKTQNPDSLKETSSPRGICHIFNLCEVIAQLPYELAPSMVLRKATPNERGYISRCMFETSCTDRPHCDFHQWRFTPQSYGFSVTEEEDVEKWRYYVIEFPFDGNFNPDTANQLNLRLASLVSEARFKWAFFSQ